MKKHFHVYYQRAALIATFPLLLAVASCTSPAKENSAAFDLVAAQKAIDARNVVFMEAWNKGDSVAVANFYRADARIMPPNATAVTGKDNIVHFLAENFKFAPSIKMTSNNLFGNEDLLVEDGSWILMDKQGKAVDQGKQIEVWKKEVGTWKLLRDCFNSDMPVPPPAK
jgi:ketosteroid isomerase-like protein